MNRPFGKRRARKAVTSTKKQTLYYGHSWTEHYVYLRVSDLFGELERQGVKEWQEEMFAPIKVYKTLEAENMVRSTLDYDYMCNDETIMRVRGWPLVMEKEEVIALETLTFEDDEGKHTSVLDRIMLQADKNPLLTNMDVDENIPQTPSQVTDEMESNWEEGVIKVYQEES